MCEVIVFLIKPIVVLTFSLQSASLDLKVMLHWTIQTIRKDDFWCNTALQCWNNVVTIRNNVTAMLQHCVALKIVIAIVSCNITFNVPTFEIYG